MEKVTLAGWDPRFTERIAQTVGDESGRRVVTFDFDNTCIRGDIGELFSHYLAETLEYRTDLDAFWDLVHPDDGRDTLRTLFDLERRSPMAFTQGPQLVGELDSLYERKLHRDGKREAYSWAVKLHVGLTEAQMFELSRECLEVELERPIEQEAWPLLDGGEVSIWRGCRPFHEIDTMMRWLESFGCEIWIVSATNQWTVSVAAELFGIPKERALGNLVHVENDVLTNELRPPAFFKEGKREAIEQKIGVRPVVAFGDTDTDIDMLQFARLGVVIDRGNEELRAAAKAGDFLIRPQSELTF